MRRKAMVKSQSRILLSVERVFGLGLLSYRQQFSETRGGSVKKATAVNSLGLLTSTLISLVSTRLLISYLSPEGFGILMTITSLTGWLALSNLGFGLALQNLLIDAVAKKDLEREKKLICTTQISLGAFCLTALAGWLLLFQIPLISWSRILNVTSSKYADEIRQAMFWSGIVVLVLVFTSYLHSIYAANQNLHRLGLWQIVSQLSGLLALILVYLQPHPMTWIVLALYGVPAGVMLLNSIRLGLTDPDRYLPRFSNFSLSELRELLKYGGSYTAIGVAGTLQYGTDNLIISHVLGPSSVALYTIVMKLFSFFQSLTGSLFMPMWAALANAKSGKDWHWIRKHFTRVRNVTMVMSVVFCLGMILSGQQLIRLWVGPTVQPGWVLITLVGVYTLTMTWIGIHSILCNALDQAPLIAILGIPSGVLTVALMYVFASICGLNGLAFGAGLGMFLGAGLPLPYIANRALEKLELDAQPVDSRHNI